MDEVNSIKSALAKAMALCASHEYCSSDIRAKLTSWGIRNEDAEKIILTLKKEKFIDDSRYASAFVKDKLKQNKWGKVKVAAHLRAKNLSGEIIQNALDEIDDGFYINMIRETINAHRKFVKAKNQFDMKGKLLRFALSKGFESHLVYDILNESDS